MTAASPFDGSLILSGPTGSGKSAISLDLADTLNAELIAMDSMTLYRGMDIGTAKPSATEQARVPHHLIDVLDPWESASVAWWRDRAIAICDEIRGRGTRPLFVGGTPFYLMAILYGLFDAPPADNVIRERLDREAESVGLAVLHERLTQIDPTAAKRIHPNDQRRIVRALEVFESTGRPISEQQQTWDSPAFGNESAPSQVTVIRIDWQREELYRRIDSRVNQMLRDGWREECERLLSLPRPLSREAEKAIGYRELFASIRERRAVDTELEALIAMRTRQFAKRQLTWFRRLKMAHVVDGSDPKREQVIRGLC